MLNLTETRGPASDALRERLNHLQALEAESIYILREAVAEFARPVMLYSIGKDSSVMLRLAQKAFYPGKIPFPLLHVDTSYKFPEMIAFRDAYTKEIGAELIVHQNVQAIADGASPWKLGTQNCCGALKTRALLDGLEAGGFDAAFGGARRDEEKSRAKERVYSFRDSAGQWDPKNQRPELWSLYNSRLRKGESIRVFSAEQLDRARYLALSLLRADSHCAALLCRRTRCRRPWRDADDRRPNDAAAAARDCREA